MTDYGHDLIFGTFITPQNQRPQDVVGLARLTERAGLDLVTFMEHPYQPAFLDTLTLLSYVAARTERLLCPGGSRYIGGLTAETGSPVTPRFLASSTWIRGTPADTGIGIGTGTWCDDSSLAATWLVAPVTEPQTESVSDPR